MTNLKIIKPKKNISFEDLREIWKYKELLYFFAWRELKIRYKQTIVGATWVIFQPLFAMIIFTVFLISWQASPLITGLSYFCVYWHRFLAIFFNFYNSSKQLLA